MSYADWWWAGSFAAMAVCIFSLCLLRSSAQRENAERTAWHKRFADKKKEALAAD
jgi:hypothetical protein